MSIIHRVASHVANKRGIRLIPYRKPWYEGPEIPLLSDRHLSGAVLLTDRQAWVDTLPKGGVGAEIGVAEGNFSERLAAVSSRLYLIDEWAEERYQSGFRKVQDRFASRLSSGEIIIERGPSTEAMTRIPDKSLDWIYIDSDHTYETTKAELEIALDKVKDGGWIAGHDYSRGNPFTGTPYGVIAAVHEFCLAHDWRVTAITMEANIPRSFSLAKIMG